MEEKKLNKSSKYLIANDLIYTVTALFAEAFFVAHFFILSEQRITRIALYFIIVYITKVILQLGIGNFIKTNPNNRVNIMAVSILLRALFILCIFLLEQNLVNYFPLAAIMFGISETLYWATHELVFIDITSNESRRDYMSKKIILEIMVKIVAPIVLGSSIELLSFSKVTIYILALSFIQIILFSKIKPSNLNVDTDEKKYSLKEYISYLKKANVKKMMLFYKSGFFFGIVLNTLATVVTIITMMTFKTSLNLGILTTIFSIFSIILLYIYEKIQDMKRYKKFMLICSFLTAISIIGLLLDISKITLVIYNFAYACTISIFSAEYNAKKGDLMDTCSVEKYNVEHVILSDIFMELANILGFALMLVAGLIGGIFAFKILLVLLTICVPLFAKSIIRVNE